MNTFLKKLLVGRMTLIRFSTASVVNSIIGMISGFVIIAWIPPGELGIWKSLLIIQSYVGIVQVGVINGLNRELPFRIGAGGKSAVRSLAATAQTYALAACGVLLLGCVATFFVSKEPMIRFALPAVFIVAATGVYGNFLSVTYRADQEFDVLARIQLVEAGINAITLALVYTIGYFGIPLRVVAIGLGRVLLLHVFRPIRVPLAFRWSDFVSLLRVGVPLFIVGYLVQVALTFPNTILLLEEGSEAVGRFAPALALFGMMTLLPKSIAQYVYAKMTFRLGKTGDLGALWRQSWQSSVGVLAVSAPLVIGAILVFPWFVKEFFPAYMDAIPSVAWIAVAGAFFGAQTFALAMSSMKAWLWLFGHTGLRVTLSFLVPYAAYLFMWDDPLKSVAAGYAVAGGISFVIGLACTFKATHPSKVTSMYEIKA